MHKDLPISKLLGYTLDISSSCPHNGLLRKHLPFLKAGPRMGNSCLTSASTFLNWSRAPVCLSYHSGAPRPTHVSLSETQGVSWPVFLLWPAMHSPFSWLFPASRDSLHFLTQSLLWPLSGQWWVTFWLEPSDSNSSASLVSLSQCPISTALITFATALILCPER